MKSKEEQIWQNLLTQSADTFEGEKAPPFGFMTCALSQLREERAGRVQMEKMGRWAVFASLAVFGVVMMITVDLQLKDRREIEPGLRSIFQMQNLQVY